LCLLKEAPFPFLKVYRLKSDFAAAVMLQDFLLVIKADQRPTSSLKIQCGIETLDSGQIQRVSQQYWISRFIKGIVF
jgi:hypothetical protein